MRCPSASTCSQVECHQRLSRNRETGVHLTCSRPQITPYPPGPSLTCMRTVLPLPAGERCLEGLQPTVGQSWWGAPFIPLWLPSWSSGRPDFGGPGPPTIWTDLCGCTGTLQRSSFRAGSGHRKVRTWPFHSASWAPTCSMVSQAGRAVSLHAGLQSPALRPAWCTSRSLKTPSDTNVSTPLPGVSPGSAPSLLCDSDRSVHLPEPPRGTGHQQKPTSQQRHGDE